ncbi:regulatory protein GemA [Paenibacillus sp. NPDC057967]|uniref:regulatory protein GemA n=1 Tax=Paenibacillus sp. NPDC057967 TaxID=3346293 RepID=UPI0036DBF04D
MSKGQEKRTQEQNRKIWALAGELGLDEGLLRDVVERLTAQRSTSTLSRTQAARLIDELEFMSGKGPAPATEVRRPGMATPEQLHLIRELEQALGWAKEPKRLQGFMRRCCKGVIRLEWLAYKQAQSLIESLKGFKKSQERQQHG